MIASFGDPRLPERFWSKVQPCPMSGCWLWTASLDRAGYGQFGIGGSAAGKGRAYGVAYGALAGPVPAGLVLDHLCRVRSCVNPAHLEPVTNRVNILRGIGFAAVHARQTECPSGHPYSGTNLYEYRGMRYCKECMRSRDIARRDKRRAEATPRTKPTNCPAGHAYEGDNLIVNRSGHRCCRTCIRANKVRYRARQREAVAC